MDKKAINKVTKWGVWTIKGSTENLKCNIHDREQARVLPDSLLDFHMKKGLLHLISCCIDPALNRKPPSMAVMRSQRRDSHVPVRLTSNLIQQAVGGTKIEPKQRV